jgi:cytochrome c biogenesis protein CcmG, thiol:disulfide interchange protein DsbE
MKKQWLIVAAVVTLLTGGAVIGVRMAPDIFPVEVGSRAPDFRAIDLATHDSTNLAAYKGQVVLLNIWATWCEPCRVEMPAIQRLYDSLHTDGLKIAAVSIDVASPDSVLRFTHSLGLTFDILQDRSRAIERIYQTTGVPESFVLDRDGRIVKKVIGAHTWDSPTNRDLVRRLLAQRR